MRGGVRGNSRKLCWLKSGGSEDICPDDYGLTGRDSQSLEEIGGEEISLPIQWHVDAFNTKMAEGRQSRGANAQLANAKAPAKDIDRDSGALPEEVSITVGCDEQEPAGVIFGGDPRGESDYVVDCAEAQGCRNDPPS